MKRSATSKPQLELLDPLRQEIFSLLSAFANNFVMGGGTAIALQIRHRESYDFDLFSLKAISKKLLNKVNETFSAYTVKPIVSSSDELSVLINAEVKITFLFYPFEPLYETWKTNSLQLFNLADLITDKAYTIGRRGAWRDYVDLFFLLKEGFGLAQIVKDAQRRFDGNFSDKLFLEQLTYFDDIPDFTIEFMNKKYPKSKIQKYLLAKARSFVQQ